MSAYLDLPDPVARALDGERVARLALKAVAANVGSGDELLEALRDAAAEDGIEIPATPRIRAFVRLLQKAIAAGSAHRYSSPHDSRGARTHSAA